MKKHVLIALSCLLVACTASPEQQQASEVYSKQGYGLLNLKRPKEALAYFDQSIAANGDNLRAYQGKGIALNELGRHKEANAAYESALKLDKENIAVINNYGLSKVLEKDYDGAISLLSPYAKTEPVHAKVLENLALAYCMKGDEAQARALYKTRLPHKKIDENIKFCKQFNKGK